MIDVFKVKSTALPAETRVVGFRGTEGISRLYSFDIYLTLDAESAESFDLGDAVGATASLVIDRHDGRDPFSFHGMMSEAALVHHEKDGRALCRVVLVPRLWKLTQTLHSRIFTRMSIPDILKDIFERSGLPAEAYALNLSAQYPEEEHVCQYRESDFEFISRWMEREGIYYHFEHGDQAEKLILADNKSAHEDLDAGPVRFFALSGGDVTAQECLHSFVCRRRSLPASVRFKDHDYAKPTLGVTGDATVSAAGAGEISVHGARFFSPDAGKRLARLRAEELLSREVVYHGSGTAYYLRSGYTFSLQDHPRQSFDAKYLVTEVEHHGNQAASTAEMVRLTGLEAGEVYRVEVTAIPSATQFRAEARSSWPRIYGTEHGVIDGEADSDYAQLDEQGRYLVRFAFDESDLGAGKASTRVRMMQPHGGGVEGWHFPLRKGTEVLFTFLGGDPDRPVIAGVVPTAHTPSPVTKSNHTRNVIQTGGRNRFELEDKEGQQRITLSTPHSSTMIRMGAPNDDHNLIVRTDGRTLLDAGQDWDVEVGGKLTEAVQGTVEESYFANQITDINTGRKETIHAGGMTHTITGTMFQKVNGDRVQDVSGTFCHKVSGAVIEEYGSYDLTCGPVKEKCGPGQFVYASVHLSSGPIVVEAPSVRIVAPDVTIQGAAVTTKAGGSYKGYTPNAEEIFGRKLVYGGLKYDQTAVKTETNGYAAGWFGVKGDTIGVKKDTAGAVMEQMNAHLEQFATAIGFGGIKVTSAGLTKIG